METPAETWAVHFGASSLTAYYATRCPNASTIAMPSSRALTFSSAIPVVMPAVHSGQRPKDLIALSDVFEEREKRVVRTHNAGPTERNKDQQ